MTLPPPGPWAPIRLYNHEGAAYIDWCLLGEERFVDPFYTGTLHHLLASPFRMTFRPRTPLATYVRSLEQVRLRSPDGIVFHMSRCGSTLVARSLAQLERFHVASEPPILEDVLRRPPVDSADSELRAVVHALACDAPPSCRYIIKADCWHMLSFDRLRRAFPNTPWVFNYRDPREVMASLIRQPAYWAVPGIPGGPTFRDLPDNPWLLPQGEYAARILAQVLHKAATAIASGGGRLLHYEELPAALWGKVAAHFGLEFSIDERDQLEHAAKVDAKTPALSFVPDSESKRAGLSAGALEVCAKWLDGPYRALELLREAGA